MATDLIGRTIGGFRVVRKLGEGGMGAVFEARDVNLDRPVALKVMRPELAASPDFVERFRLEGRAVARFQHPNAVLVYASGEAEGLLFMAFELVPGRDLGTVLRAEGRLPIPRALALVGQLLAALEKAHAVGIVHRDLKPANLMVVSEGDREHLKVLDLGIAKLKEVDASALTAPGTILGTLAYMSPEQASGEPVGARSDLYSTGIILYELLVGSPPFTGRTATELLAQQIGSPPPPPRVRRPEIPDGLEAAILRALAKRPADRYPDARTFAATLEGLGPTLPEPPLRPGTTPPAPRQLETTAPGTAPRVAPLASPTTAPRVVPLAPPTKPPTAPLALSPPPPPVERVPPPQPRAAPSAGGNGLLVFLFLAGGMLALCVLATVIWLVVADQGD